MTWLPVPGFEGYYEVSDIGQVRSLATGQLRATPIASNGYRMVTLQAQGRRRNVTVHSLVAAAFIGPRPAAHEVRHLDGDRMNNSATNLAYGTRSENARDMVGHGGHNNARKTHCKHGHEFTPENTRVGPGGGRICRTCHRATSNVGRRDRMRGVA